MKREELLEVSNLHTSFLTEDGEVEAVRGITFTLGEGKSLGIVGESGCGKSVTALSIMGLLQHPAKIKEGEVLYRGRDLLKLSNAEMMKIRGSEIAMIFQEPMTALNPVFTIGDQITEVITLHQGLTKRDAIERASELLGLVGIPSPERRVNEYPHQLSGGMRQRAMIAMALSCEPSLLIADEPTTALDVTIQAQILTLIRELQESFKMAMVLITHDLGVIAEVVDEVAVMYAGRIVELADTETLFENPLHPYTIGLLNSMPRLGRGDDDTGRLKTIPGSVPRFLGNLTGCTFADRCPWVDNECTMSDQVLREVEPQHWIACRKDQASKR
ncbi:MAG: ABC transporter ATP-binding protein [Deltaproteobacteria bacterium]|nr:ABC transporter ATP-binding protein [Deltaproteobacteria bacterium]